MSSNSDIRTGGSNPRPAPLPVGPPRSGRWTARATRPRLVSFSWAAVAAGTRTR
jgi:hypothetical protein